MTRLDAFPRPANTAAPAQTPWWRIGMVWLVIGGPLVVVFAAIGTAVIAVRGADIVLTDMPAAMEPGRTSPTAQTPAHQARNHAATAARP
jgi:uncharacterized protein